MDEASDIHLKTSSLKKRPRNHFSSEEKQRISNIFVTCERSNSEWNKTVEFTAEEAVFTFNKNEEAVKHHGLDKNKLSDQNLNFSCTFRTSRTSLIKKSLALESVSTIYPSLCWMCSGFQCSAALNALNGRNTYSGMRFIQTNHCKVKNGTISLSCGPRKSTSKIPSRNEAADSNIILMTSHDNMTLPIVSLINHSCDTSESEFEALKNITISLQRECIKQQEEKGKYDLEKAKRHNIGYVSSLKRSAQEEEKGEEAEAPTTKSEAVASTKESEAVTSTTESEAVTSTTESEAEEDKDFDDDDDDEDSADTTINPAVSANDTTTTQGTTTTEPPEKNIGKSLVYLEGDDMVCSYRECNLGNMICDAMIKYVAYHTNNISGIGSVYWSNATIALLNGGLINNSITADKDGFITNKQLREAVELNDPVYIFWLKAQDLKDTIERSVTISEAHNYDNFLQVSGLNYKYDLGRPQNKRILEIRALCQDCKELMYIPLNYSDYVNYKLVGTHSLVKDALGDHTVLRSKAQKNILLEFKLIEIIEWYFEFYSPILAGIENRIDAVVPMITTSGCKTCLHTVSLYIILLFLYLPHV